jgi:hypothetical protein
METKQKHDPKLVILLRRLLSIPPTLQLYHWQTRSHARHLASGSLYDALIEQIDEFMEVFMGRHHRIRLPERCSLPLRSLDAKSAVSYLKDNIAFFSNLETFLPALRTDTDLLSIRDLIVAEMNKTLYLFTLR